MPMPATKEILLILSSPRARQPAHHCAGSVSKKESGDNAGRSERTAPEGISGPSRSRIEESSGRRNGTGRTIVRWRSLQSLKGEGRRRSCNARRRYHEHRPSCSRCRHNGDGLPSCISGRRRRGRLLPRPSRLPASEMSTPRRQAPPRAQSITTLPFSYFDPLASVSPLFPAGARMSATPGPSGRRSGCILDSFPELLARRSVSNRSAGGSFDFRRVKAN
jgi:hypothetical protein